MKKVISFALFILVLLTTVNSFAAPASINGSDPGIAGLVIVKKPETPESTTTKQVYTVTAYCNENTEVSIYRFNPNTGLFDILRDAAGNPVSNYVGATGLYLRDIELDSNTNHLVVRADLKGYYQQIRLDITLLNQGLIDNISRFSSNFQSMFGGW